MTKKEVQDRAKGILRGTPPGVWLEGDDFEFMRNLFMRHPEAVEKQPIISGIKVGKPPAEYRGQDRCFHVQTEDGCGPWSYLKALSGETVASAARRAVMPVVNAIKATYLRRHEAVCQHCGQETLVARLQVHHEHPRSFRNILDLYAEVFGPIKTEDHNDRLADPEHFVEWHNDLATLSVVCAECNRAAERKAA